MSTRQGGQRVGFLLAFVCLGLIVMGCGGGASSSSSSASVSGSTIADANEGSEPSAQFLEDTGGGKYAAFGAEASSQEREAANLVVRKNLKARADANFRIQCETLSLKTVTITVRVKSRQECPAVLKRSAEPLSRSKKVREDTLDGSIAALRVKGDNGYALYHGNDGKDWAVPLEKEHGSWKVTALVMIEL
jgi:hypothetical protein